MDDQYFQSEIYRLLRLGPDQNQPDDFGESAVADLPVAQTTPQPVQPPQAAQSAVLAMPEQKRTQTIPGLLAYPAIFAGAFIFFYVALNFGAIAQQVSGWFVKSEDEQILEETLEPYYNWIGGYFFAVGDKQLLEPANDIDKDGLTNHDEFIIKTNPTLADSDSDGISDGIEVINGTNYWGQGGMTDKQKDLVRQIDAIRVNNRISFNAAGNNNQAAVEVSANYDLSKPGRLSIPRLNMQVPLVWTEDPAQFETDLTRGVVHYPGTALPGQRGISYISGHSSDYFWKNHPYKQIFAGINNLSVGDDIFVDIYGKDGKLYNFRYSVTAKNIYKPDDQAQFIGATGSLLNLSTCWPIGTQKDRFVVTATLQGS